MHCLILMVERLKDELKQKLPQWYKDTKSKYSLILTDDLDSLFGCAILKAQMNWDIKEVMLFNARHNSEISVDWHGVADNATHEAINLNHICGINRNIYGQKYNSSTVLLLWSLYDLPKENLPDELMMLLLTIDSTYYSFFHNNKQFQRQNHEWLVNRLFLPQFYEYNMSSKKLRKNME